MQPPERFPLEVTEGWAVAPEGARRVGARPPLMEAQEQHLLFDRGKLRDGGGERSRLEALGGPQQGAWPPASASRGASLRA